MGNITLTKKIQNNTFTFNFNNFKKVIFPEVKMGNVSLYDLLLNSNELELIKFISTLNNKYSNIYDLGANVGAHSAFYSQFFKKVYAYEPYDFHLKKLREVKKEINSRICILFQKQLLRKKKKRNF